MNILNKQTIATFDGAAQEAAASAFGSAIGHVLDKDFVVLTKAKQDYEGGPFVVLFNLYNHLTPEQWAALPDHEAETGNNPRFYKTKKIKADGKEKLSDRDYFKVVADSIPDVQAKHQRNELLSLSMKDPTKFNLSSVPQDIKDMPEARRYSEISQNNTHISTAHRNVISALELYSQMKRFEGLAGVEMNLLYALNEDGTKELDGSKEVGGIMKIDPTKSPIQLVTKLERRRDVDKARVGVGSFMRFNVPKAIEQGGSWDALMATVKKGTKEKDKDGKDNAKLIRTPDTAAQTMTDFADYLVYCQDDRTKAAWEAFTKSLEGAGSDDNFYCGGIIFAALENIYANPKNRNRFQALFTEREKAAA